MAVDDDLDNSVDENLEEYGQAALNEGQNNDEIEANASENNSEQENDEHELALDDTA